MNTLNSALSNWIELYSCVEFASGPPPSEDPTTDPTDDPSTEPTDSDSDDSTPPPTDEECKNIIIDGCDEIMSAEDISAASVHHQQHNSIDWRLWSCRSISTKLSELFGAATCVENGLELPRACLTVIPCTECDEEDPTDPDDGDDTPTDDPDSDDEPEADCDSLFVDNCGAVPAELTDSDLITCLQNFSSIDNDHMQKLSEMTNEYSEFCTQQLDRALQLR